MFWTRWSWIQLLVYFSYDHVIFWLIFCTLKFYRFIYSIHWTRVANNFVSKASRGLREHFFSRQILIPAAFIDCIFALAASQLYNILLQYFGVKNIFIPTDKFIPYLFNLSFNLICYFDFSILLYKVYIQKYSVCGKLKSASSQ